MAQYMQWRKNKMYYVYKEYIFCVSQFLLFSIILHIEKIYKL